MTANSTNPKPRKLTTIIALIAVTAVVTFGLAALLLNIFARKQEGQTPFFRVVELTDDTEDPAQWGKNFPLQYDGYLKTVDMVRTRFGGSESVPREPSEDDPRGMTSRQKLDMIPQLKRMWAGYAFSIDFREARGHAYMLEDQMFTERQTVPQPGTCLQCHGSMYVPMKTVGDGDLVAGFEKLNAMPYAEAATHVNRAVACIDCHDPDSMQLRITRPAFMAGIRAYKASQGVEDYDVNAQATRHEMRTYVCAQCHVEYYFSGDSRRLTFPWNNGLKVDEALEYYDDIGFTDWVHKDTGAPMLKVQHPEFELWSQGIHSRAGVTCADCHMPYTRVGAMKISDHHLRSPLLNINNACQTCHNVSETELLARAETIQERTNEVVRDALDALMDLIDDIVAAKVAGASDEQLATAMDYQRKATFYVDWVEAENSEGFHADQEAARIGAKSINFSRLGQMAVRDALTGTE